MNSGIRRVGAVVILLFVGLVAQLTYLQVNRSDQLDNNALNARKFLKEVRRDRGPIITADGVIVAQSIPVSDEFQRLRVYPAATAALFAQVVGYQSIQFGSTGVEAAYGPDLSGETFAVNAQHLADLFAKRQPVGSVVLTLSKLAQQTAATALNGRRGSVVVLDVRTGGVLAAYSNPTFDPNLLTSHDPKKAQAAFAFLQPPLRPDNPMLARAWRELYPPGSTFKTVTASIALENNVDTNKVFPTLTQLPLPLTTATLHNFGNEHCGGSLLVGFIVSCNTTFGQVGLDLGETLAEGIQRFGVGTSPPNSADSGIEPPIVASTGPKTGTFHSAAPTFAQAAIGQNAVAVTPLEMALVAESVATGGVILDPHFVDCVKDPNDIVVRQVGTRDYRRAMSPQTADTMRQFMLSVVNDPRGTGTAAQISGVQVAGKTGTAETAPGENPHAWFIAFAPADAPRYAIAVLVEHGGVDGTNAEVTGGRVAAPIAKQVLQTLLQTPEPASQCNETQPSTPSSGG